MKPKATVFFDLTPDIAEAKRYGEVVLEVDFCPITDWPHNYDPDCWQCRVYAAFAEAFNEYHNDPTLQRNTIV